MRKLQRAGRGGVVPCQPPPIFEMRDQAPLLRPAVRWTSAVIWGAQGSGVLEHGTLEKAARIPPNKPTKWNINILSPFVGLTPPPTNDLNAWFQNVVLRVGVILSVSVPQEDNWLFLGGRMMDDFPPFFLFFYVLLFFIISNYDYVRVLYGIWWTFDKSFCCLWIFYFNKSHDMYTMLIN